MENAVLVVERWILAVLRKRQFFSLAELNLAISECLEKLNTRPFKKQPGCRRGLFEQLDQPALRPLPLDAYVYGEWKKARVHIDYHVAVEGHFYSVPHALVKKQLDIRISRNTIECFHQNQRVASHRRSCHPGHHTTVTAHMPKAHREMVEWTPERLTQWAEKTGPSTAQVVVTIMASRQHPQPGYRACLGILRLGKTYGNERLEAACRRALTLGSYRYKSIASILEHRLDEVPLREEPAQTLPRDHGNIRGPSYYN